ncbi:Endoribonuclease L-PSP/chorismate mutase-like protein [Ilyonectria destructans]|nr:Endoribonuclease L-PSP/chorismate mutase-like protein [Ilyonectria destructans]
MTAIQKEEVRTDSAPAPMPCLSQGVKVGHMVYVSGSLGIDPATGKSISGTVGDRTTQILKNITNILEAAGTNIDNVVKVNVFLDDMDNFDQMNEAYYAVFNKGVRPVRTCVAVKQLPFGADVEIEASAHL